jgi:hypothetical protein
MSDEIQDVNQTEVEPVTPSADEQQDSNDSEVVQTQNPVQENLKKALQAERERRREAEAKLAEREQQELQKPLYQNEDDAYQRFVKLEAEVKIQKKLTDDPTFLDRKDLVIETMEKSGYDIDVADSMVKSQLYDQLVKESATQIKEVVPNQIKTQATPEPSTIKRSGNILDDVESGAVNIDPAMRAVVMKYRNRG